MNRGAVGTRPLVVELQEALNPRPAQVIQRCATAFALGDKVTRIENDDDKDACKGDIGVVRASDAYLGTVTAEYDGRLVRCGAHELDHVVLACSTAVHETQGCEYPAVVIPKTAQRDPMLRRNLTWIGITRRRTLVGEAWQTKAPAIAVRGSRAAGRRSGSGWAPVFAEAGARGPRRPAPQNRVVGNLGAWSRHPPGRTSRDGRQALSATVSAAERCKSRRP